MSSDTTQDELKKQLREAISFLRIAKEKKKAAKRLRLKKRKRGIKLPQDYCN